MNNLTDLQEQNAALKSENADLKKDNIGLSDMVENLKYDEKAIQALKETAFDLEHENEKLQTSLTQANLLNQKMRDALERFRNFIRYNGHTGQHSVFGSTPCTQCQLQNNAEKVISESVVKEGEE